MLPQRLWWWLRNSDLWFSSEEDFATYRGNKKCVFDVKPGFVTMESRGLTAEHGDSSRPENGTTLIGWNIDGLGRALIQKV